MVIGSPASVPISPVSPIMQNVSSSSFSRRAARKLPSSELPSSELLRVVAYYSPDAIASVDRTYEVHYPGRSALMMSGPVLAVHPSHHRRRFVLFVLIVVQFDSLDSPTMSRIFAPRI